MAGLVNLLYLLAASLFIFGLKELSHPSTARRGNQLASIGMLIAVVTTLFVGRIISPELILAGLVIGATIGTLLARKVKMTAMPELVAVFNGFGGGASALVAASEVAVSAGRVGEPGADPLLTVTSVTIVLGILIGTVTFSGSFIAFGKLAEFITGRPVTFPGSKIVSGLVVAGILAAGVYVVIETPNFVLDPEPVIWGIVIVAALAFIFGILLVMPIGGADMPVIVALLNSYSGLAAAATGFVLVNYGLIISGALVGAAGLILTKIMCDAMNRSLTNVLFGAFGGGGADDGAVGVAGVPEGRTVREISSEDAAILMNYAGKVIVVPGYGMAVAQAQHQVREMADRLQANGVTVKYAIHPVAGRMPGHMNVLLAEANVPYDLLFDMDEINPEFETADVALIIGANDVVNPAARDNPASPIYGMPILNVDKAQNVIVLKRSMRPGFAGVENELFFHPRTSMLFGDAKQSLTKLITELKGL